MDTMWILVADQSRARSFAIDGESRRPRKIEDRVNPEGRAHERDLVTDGPGRYFGKGERDRAHISDEVTKRIVAEIDKDVSWYEPRALEEFLQEHAKRRGLTPKSRAR
jgi:hypothetical protein